MQQLYYNPYLNILIKRMPLDPFFAEELGHDILIHVALTNSCAQSSILMWHCLFACHDIAYCLHFSFLYKVQQKYISVESKIFFHQVVDDFLFHFNPLSITFCFRAIFPIFDIYSHEQYNGRHALFSDAVGYLLFSHPSRYRSGALYLMWFGFNFDHNQ